MFFRILKLVRVREIPVLFCRSVHQYKLKMDKAYLREVGDDRFEMAFHYVDNDLKINRQFNFNRTFSETIDIFLGRITTNFEKVANKKNKKKNAEVNELPKVIANFIIDEKEVPQDKTCSEVFLSNKKVSLQLQSKVFEVQINSPWITEIALPSYILATFPLYPSKFEGSNVEKNLSKFTWSKSKDNNKWTVVGEEFIYVPSNQDIGEHIKLSCLPRSNNGEGPCTETISKKVVEAGPGTCPFETRHAFTKIKTEGKEFRVVTYNILADLYANSDHTREVLFPYCPAYALNIDYRSHLLLKEIIGYNGDIICLQEVDIKVYKNQLVPLLSHLDYGHVLTTKGKEIAEGLAFFYNKIRFKLLDTQRVLFSEELSTNPLFCELWVALSKNDSLITRILNRGTTLQVNVVESLDCSEVLVVANIHLYFHPDADHIRLIHAGMAIKYLENYVANLKNKILDKRISLIFCGDFNSVPECGIFKLYTKGSVPSDHIDFKSNMEESIDTLEFQQSFQLDSACGTPQFTNFTAGFADCLDYIFYEKTNLKVSQVIPLPSTHELAENVALPSIVFPSDHIALISDLKWS